MHQRISILLLVCALAPIFLLIVLFDSYAMNVPLWDDHALKAFLLTWEKENLWKGLNALFSQHNEHRIAFTRFITLFTFWVNGTLNYRILMAIGNLTLLGTWLLWAIRWKYHPDRWIWWAIGSWLLFTLALYENFYWGMASLQNFGIIFFALASFYGLAQKPKSAVHLTWPLWAGWFLGTIALFTSGNGLIVPLLGVVILIVQKRWKAFFWTGGLWAICLLLHLVTFTQRTDLSAPEPAVWNGLDIAWRFFVLAGSITDMLEIWPSAREGIAVAWGVLMTGITLIYLIRIPFQLLFKRYLPLTATQLMLGAFALFVLGTILGTILARLSYPVTILFTSKYKIYSNLLTLLAFSFVVFLLPIYLKRNWAWLCLGLSGLLYLNSYLIDFRFHLYTHQERTADLANLHFANQVGSIPMTQHPYQHPTSSLAASMANALMEPAPQWIDSVAIQPEYVHYFEFGEEMPGKAAYLVVRGDSSIQARPLYRAVQPNLLKRIFKPWAYSMAGTVSRMNLPSGLYETYIWQDKSGSGRWLDAQKTIRIKGFVFKEKPKNW